MKDRYRKRGLSIVVCAFAALISLNSFGAPGELSYDPAKSVIHSGKLKGSTSSLIAAWSKRNGVVVAQEAEIAIANEVSSAASLAARKGVYDEDQIARQSGVIVGRYLDALERNPQEVGSIPNYMENAFQIAMPKPGAETATAIVEIYFLPRSATLFLNERVYSRSPQNRYLVLVGELVVRVMSEAGKQLCRRSVQVKSLANEAIRCTEKG